MTEEQNVKLLKDKAEKSYYAFIDARTKLKEAETNFCRARLFYENVKQLASQEHPRKHGRENPRYNSILMYEKDSNDAEAIFNECSKNYEKLWKAYCACEKELKILSKQSTC